MLKVELSAYLIMSTISLYPELMLIWVVPVSLPIRVKAEDGSKYYAHTLNNTVVAPPRMLIALLENHLQEDGSVIIPEVLRPYMGGKEVITPKK